jgi:hypothetical protein
MLPARLNKVRIMSFITFKMKINYLIKVASAQYVGETLRKQQEMSDKTMLLVGNKNPFHHGYGKFFFQHYDAIVVFCLSCNEDTRIKVLN